MSANIHNGPPMMTSAMYYAVSSGVVGSSDNIYSKIMVIPPLVNEKLSNCYRLHTLRIHAASCWNASNNWTIDSKLNVIWTFTFDEVQLALLETQLQLAKVNKISEEKFWEMIKYDDL